MTDKEIAAFCLRCTKDSLDCPLAAGDYDRAVELSCCRNQKRIVIEPECAEAAKKRAQRMASYLRCKAKDPEKDKLRQRAYREAHKEELQAKRRAYYKANREMIIAQESERRRKRRIREALERIAESEKER